MTKKKEGVWLTGRWAFITDPNEPNAGLEHHQLAIEWVYFAHDDDDKPTKRWLEIVEAFGS